MSTSFIIPARAENQEFGGQTTLWHTVVDLLAHATGEFEILVGLDGPPFQLLPADSRLRVLIYDQPIGARAMLNALAAAAQGDYLLKADAHCAFGTGINEILARACGPQTIVVPRFYHIDLERWTMKRRQNVDYFFLTCPWTHPKYFQMMSAMWVQRTHDCPEPLVDELMTFQGSCWFMSKAYWQQLGGVAPDAVYGPYAEHQELTLKCWLGGGQVLIHKGAWYAHQQRTNSHGRGAWRALTEFHHSHINVARQFCLNRWPERVRDFGWLVEKFWPLPTAATNTIDGPYFWPEDWRSVLCQGDPRER
jgi:hypothetical protein